MGSVGDDVVAAGRILVSLYIVEGQMQIVLNRVEDGADESFARICAELVRQGVKFDAKSLGNDFIITFTGGF